MLEASLGCLDKWSRAEERRGEAQREGSQHHEVHTPTWLPWSPVQGSCEVARDHGFGVGALIQTSSASHPLCDLEDAT